MASLKVACVVALMCIIFVGAPMAEAAISCGTVVSDVAPCIPYLKGGPGPSGSCCSGVKNLNKAAATTPDRRAACACLKTAASSITGLDNSRVAALPGACRVNLPFKFTTATNCATIRF